MDTALLRLFAAAGDTHGNDRTRKDRGWCDRDLRGLRAGNTSDGGRLQHGVQHIHDFHPVAIRIGAAPVCGRDQSVHHVGRGHVGIGCPNQRSGSRNERCGQGGAFQCRVLPSLSAVPTLVRLQCVSEPGRIKLYTTTKIRAAIVLTHRCTGLKMTVEVEPTDRQYCGVIGRSIKRSLRVESCGKQQL